MRTAKGFSRPGGLGGGDVESPGGGKKSLLRGGCGVFFQGVEECSGSQKEVILNVSKGVKCRSMLIEEYLREKCRTQELIKSLKAYFLGNDYKPKKSGSIVRIQGNLGRITCEVLLELRKRLPKRKRWKSQDTEPRGFLGESNKGRS